MSLNIEKHVLIFSVLLVALLLILLAPFTIRANTLPNAQNCPTCDVTQFIAIEANKYGIDPKIALYVSYEESKWQIDAVGDYGTSFGIWQIHNPQQKGITKPQAEDLIFSTEWAMKTMVKDGGCRQWSTCPTTDSS